jgi:hypothetical protein
VAGAAGDLLGERGVCGHELSIRERTSVYAGRNAGGTAAAGREGSCSSESSIPASGFQFALVDRIRSDQIGSQNSSLFFGLHSSLFT